MSKQSDAKLKQGWRKFGPCCGNCQKFTSDKTPIKLKWRSEPYIKENNLRCSEGNFKIGKSNYCTNHKFKENE